MLLVACQSGGPAASRSPLSPEERRTTSGEIALANLQGEIDVLERSVEVRPGDVAAIEELVDRLLTRAAFLGRIVDYERAAALGERAVETAPDRGTAYVVRARTRGALHRFDDALADLAEAERLGAGGNPVDEIRAGIFEETGRHAEARRIRERLRSGEPDILRTGAEAAMLARLGEIATAERLFTEAQHQYEDVSPFPFAWLYFRQGLMWEGEKNSGRARELYEAALARFPGYAPAVSHLAALEAAAGRRGRAIELLRPLVESSDDPEYEGQLAALLREEGKTAEADRLRDRAARRFEALMARHPKAFAAKAARFQDAAG